MDTRWKLMFTCRSSWDSISFSEPLWMITGKGRVTVRDSNHSSSVSWGVEPALVFRDPGSKFSDKEPTPATTPTQP